MVRPRIRFALAAAARDVARTTALLRMPIGSNDTLDGLTSLMIHITV